MIGVCVGDILLQQLETHQHCCLPWQGVGVCLDYVVCSPGRAGGDTGVCGSDHYWGRCLNLCITDDLCIASVCALIVHVTPGAKLQLERSWLPLALCCDAHVCCVWVSCVTLVARDYVLCGTRLCSSTCKDVLLNICTCMAAAATCAVALAVALTIVLRLSA
jgi:hypothetical protein